MSIIYRSNDKKGGNNSKHFYVKFSFFHLNLLKSKKKGAAAAPFLDYTVGWLAASMICTNFSGTREAPPIRPPSMSG